MIKSGFIDRWFHVEVILQLRKTLFCVFYYLNLGLNEYFTAVENEGITIIINIKVNTWKMSAKSSQESNFKKKPRVSNEWKVIFANVSVNSNKFFSCFHSDLSMNNITELPAYVFKTFPYLEELWVHAPSKWCIYSVQCWHEGWSLWYAPGYFSLHCKVHRACPSS